jgi:peptidyl-prolyl cis-trans isomerase C
LEIDLNRYSFSLTALGALFSLSVHAQLVDPDAAKVLASRGTAKTTVEMVDAMVSRVPEDQRAALVASRSRVQQLIEASLITQQLSNKGRELGLHLDPKTKLRMEAAANEILGEVAVDHLVKNAPAKNFDAVAKEAYLANPNDYKVPAGFKVQHILISKDGRTEEQVKSLADEVLAKAKAGENFLELVNAYSDDPSKIDNKGMLTIDKEGQFVEQFDQAARAFTKPGDFAALTATVYGTHIIQYLERTPAGTTPFEDVKASLVAKYDAEYREEVRRKLYSDFRADNPVINEDVIDLLRDRFGLKGSRPSFENEGQK